MKPCATSVVLSVACVAWSSHGDMMGGPLTQSANLTPETAIAWGQNDCGRSHLPSGLTKVTAIAAGGNRSLALRRDGTVAVANVFGSVTSRVATLAVPTGPGCLDPTFHLTAGGTLPGAEDWVRALTLQQDGKVLIGGTFGEDRRGLARLNSDGTTDASFQPPWSHRLDVRAVRVLPGQKILVLARNYEPPHVGGLMRLHADGSLDTSFTNYWPGDWVPYVRCLALQTDGKILVGGEFTEPRAGLARFNPDGTLDETFTPPNLWAYDGAGVSPIAVQADGKILVVGPWNTPFFRLDPDGSEDASFRPDPDTASRVNAILPQADGRILVGLRCSCARSATVARLEADGRLDESFVRANLDTIPGILALQPDGRILVGGGPIDCDRDVGVYRLQTDGSLDITFQARLGEARIWPVAAAVVVQPDGQVLVGGHFTSVNGSPAVLVARLDGDPAAAPFVHRGVSDGSYLPDKPLTIRLIAVPSARTGAYVVEDRPPAGWSVGQISSGGIYAWGAGMVRYGPFPDAEPRVLSYETTPPRGATGRAVFSGQGWFDGERVIVGGTPKLEQGCRLAYLGPSLPNQFGLILRGEPGAAFLIEVSSALWTWTPLVTLTNTLGQVSFTDTNCLGYAQRFYRAKRIE